VEADSPRIGYELPISGGRGGNVVVWGGRGQYKKRTSTWTMGRRKLP